MAKRTKKVGIIGKYATRYGSAQRKSIKKFEITQRATYACAFCGKVSPPTLTCSILTIFIELSQESSCWNLEVQGLQEGHRWRCLVTVNSPRSDHQGNHAETQKTPGGSR